MSLDYQSEAIMNLGQIFSLVINCNFYSMSFLYFHNNCSNVYTANIYVFRIRSL